MPIANIPLPLHSVIRARANDQRSGLWFSASLLRPSDFSCERMTRSRGSSSMIPLASIAVATILLAAAATVSSKVMSAEIEERLEILENSHVVYHENVKRGKRGTEGNQPHEEEASYPLRRESSADELAAAVGPPNVGYRDTGNYANHHPRQAAGNGWRDAVPGTPGMDYPNLDSVPITSFTCMDKEPGGYYADVETGCQVFHVCNTGGVKSSFLCPPGSIFNQRYFVCDWWYGFNCQKAVDLYFKKPEANFSELSEDSFSSVFQSSETTTAITDTFNLPPGKYSQESRIRNYVNPSNDLSLESTGQGTVGYLSSHGSRRMDEPSHYENNVRDYTSEPRSLKSPDHGATDDVVPRGFSGYDNKSFKRKKNDRAMTPHDLTTNLASYVNYAYFQAGLNNNDNHNYDDNNNNTEEKFDQIEPDNDSKSETSFGDKLVYEKSSRHEYSETDDPRRTRSSKSIDEYE